MAGLPHYKNSHASMEKWEPVYLNLFEILITPPEAVDSWEYVLDNVIKVAGLEVEQTPAPVEQIYKGAKRRFAGALPDNTGTDITVDFEVNLNSSNSMYVYKGLRKWCDLIWDPLTGAMTLKKDYSGGPMTISLYNKVGDVTRQWIFPVIFPMSNIPAMELDYSSGGNIFQISLTFAADSWEDMSV